MASDRIDPIAYEKEMEIVHTEWRAWRSLCTELENASASIDINEEESLANAIRRWGEELHQLRLAKPEYDEKALAEAREKYPNLVES